MFDSLKNISYLCSVFIKLQAKWGFPNTMLPTILNNAMDDEGGVIYRIESPPIFPLNS